MSGQPLAAYVHVADDNGRMHVFGPEDDMSAPDNQWAVARITNPKAWDGGTAPVVDEDPDVRVARLRRELDAAEAAAREADKQPADPVDPVEPPRSGAGSGRDAWAAYAEKVGVEVPEGASRDDIIAAVDQAKAAE